MNRRSFFGLLGGSIAAIVVGDKMAAKPALKAKDTMCGLGKGIDSSRSAYSTYIWNDYCHCSTGTYLARSEDGSYHIAARHERIDGIYVGRIYRDHTLISI